MKIKFLLPALAGLAMASCSQDEDFVGANVQKGEFSPITFSVSREDGADTRAWESDADGRWDNFTFGTGDLLSLFNGASFAENATAWTTIGQNAVFEGEGKGEELEFKTRSLVLEGKAIMVYPADTIFANTGTALVVKVPSEQTETTKKFIPYVSDVMTIAGYDGNEGIDKNNSAGYGRKYDVILRPAASLFGMKLAPTKPIDFAALGVKEVEFTKVEMINGTANLFTTEANITPSATASNLKTVDAEKFGHFDVQADVTQASGKVSANISTEDIKDNIAYFTLLPVADGDEVDDAASIKVSTTYGSVTVSNNTAAEATDKGPLQNNAGDKGKNLKENLTDVITNIWRKNDSSKFGEENQGRVIRRTLSLDLSTLDMRGTIVKTSEQLVNVLKVYKALGIDENGSYAVVNLILAGDDGEFIMSGDALKALETYNKAKKIKLDVATNSQKIVLNDESATLDKLKAETVIFVDGSNSAKNVDVVLGENVEWTLDQAYTNSKINSIASRGKLTYTNKTNATAALAYPLTVEGEMAFGNNKTTLGVFEAGEDSEITVASGQTVTFNGAATLEGTISNLGTLSANNAVTNKGSIDNQFEVSVLKGSASAKITNIGNIHNNGMLAVTFITENEDDANKGRIKLTGREDNVSVKDGAKKGYITYTLNVPEAGAYTFTASDSDVFNWLTIETTGVGAKVNVNDDITYLEIKGNAANVITPTSGITVTDLFVNPSMRLLGANKITATNIYVNDYILHSGNLAGTMATEYTSGVFGEEKDTETYAKGQIRTVSGN